MSTRKKSRDSPMHSVAGGAPRRSSRAHSPALEHDSGATRRSSRAHSPSSEQHDGQQPRRSSARPRSSKNGLEPSGGSSSPTNIASQRSESPIFFPASPLSARSPSPTQMLGGESLLLHTITEESGKVMSPMKLFAERVISDATIAAFVALGAVLPATEEPEVASVSSPPLLPEVVQIPATEELLIAGASEAGAGAGMAAADHPVMEKEPEPADAARTASMTS